MVRIYEVRFHGRGGQGVKMSSHVLGRAAFLSGFFTQDFAVYGAERRGAPLTSFCRISKEPVATRGYIFEPDYVICLDPTLRMDIVTNGLKNSGFLLLNSTEKPNIDAKFKIKNIDATRIALEIIGRPIPNIAILGAFAKLTDFISMRSLEKAIRIELEEAGHAGLIDANIKAARKCYRVMK
ncbi:MAG: 2-oxoacid:acceptor oxidoreductase family protein [Candidatus Aenigmarchaeota archaeon]|nr:2-oxoacid:acceptor oxidoreductase family protein [Candidatus Aenigmarchaeota archaeon]